MGYHLTSVYGISPDDTHQYFVFYVGHDFEDEISMWLDRNFVAIAESLVVKIRGLLLGVFQKNLTVRYWMSTKNNSKPLLSNKTMRLLRVHYLSFLGHIRKNTNRAITLVSCL